ncbi:MAG: helix-turn-helix domain-containing protein [Bacteroidota bacterium]
MERKSDTIFGQNLRFLRKRNHLTQQSLADTLELSRHNIGSYEEGRSTPKYEALEVLADFFDITIDVFLREDLSQLSEREFQACTQWSKSKQWERNFRVLQVAVDNKNRENILFVPQKASAGYLNGYGDREFIEESPRFYLPMLGSGSFRAFEIKGDSMLPLKSGTVVIGEYLDNWQDIKDGQTYVIISDTEGIVYKRVYSKFNAEEGELLLKSDNTYYPPISMKLEDIREIWKAKMFMSQDFPDPDMSLERLSAIVQDMQRKMG